MMFAMQALHCTRGRHCDQLEHKIIRLQARHAAMKIATLKIRELAMV